MPRLPFHIVEPSPWPITTATSSMLIALGLINWFHYNNMYLLYLGLILMMLSMLQWWRDIIREATFMGKHTTHVQSGLRMGMMLFIVSEICFFLAFFWAFFHSSLTPVPELGCLWPPQGIETIDPMGVPLLNTMILLCSGLTITMSHHSLLLKKRLKAITSLVLTIILGIYFTILQMMEYISSLFTIADSVYGSTFFMATGFHGAHVIIGTTFLMINLVRMFMNHLSSKHHFSFEAAAWYWHFVDVVWICLFISIYWWGSL